jgi:YVTN family beta-propeller protein
VAGRVFVTVGSTIYVIDDSDNLEVYGFLPGAVQGAQFAKFIQDEVYFTASGTDRVFKLDPYTGADATLVVNDFPASITSNDTTVFVGSGSGTELKITAIDISTFTATISASLGAQPASVAWLDPYVWFVSNDRNVRSYDPSSDSVISTLQLPVSTEAQVVTAHDGYLYVASTVTNKVHKIDPAGPTSVANVSAGSLPRDLVVADGDLFVANLNSDTVTRIDLASFTVTATITGFNQPLRLTTSGQMLWVTNIGNNSVARVDLSGNTISATIAMLGTPRAMAYVPDRALSGIFVGAVVF